MGGELDIQGLMALTLTPLVNKLEQKNTSKA